MHDDNRNDSEQGPPGVTRDSDAVQVLHRQALILDCFSRGQPRLRASDVRAATGLPTTTVARILRTLVQENLLQRTGDYYSIGLRVMAWSAAATAGSDLIDAARPIVSDLRDRTGESCIVYVRQGGARVAVLMSHSEQSIIYQGKVGQIQPLNAGAAGKIFMAHEPEALALALDAGLPAFTPNTITSVDRLTDDLALTRQRGWAYSPEERERGLSSMAAPLTDARDALVGALAIGAPAFRLSPESAAQHAPALVECAKAISQQLL
ncbi:IclR family transcriptional regulator [Parafrankia sp. EUN1f]|uniref:IclR family transcriptional regulator n=1 Tax=Parafrankia sp. EUN1f TaxID=102897 RepID=UPI0001C446F3|nr:IclR family transcriptional regulator [Parafrankia sp. EUN1f]EFC84128.1 transcriptional regulator, IclR family [Parafrankia sp. EUN1f]